MIGNRQRMYVAATLGLALNGAVLIAVWAKVDNGLMIGIAHACVGVLALWWAWEVSTVVSARAQAMTRPAIARFLAALGGVTTLLAVSSVGIALSAHVTVPSSVAAAPNAWLLADRERETVSLIIFGSLSLLFAVWLLETRGRARRPWFRVAGLTLGILLAQFLFWSRALHWVGK